MRDTARTPSTRRNPRDSAKKSATVAALPGRGERDAALMQRISRAGDAAAFEEVARHYSPRLKAWLTSRGENGATAEDIVQDVLVTVWHKAELFDPAKANLSTWLYRLTRNKWIDYKRKHGRMQPTAPDLMVHLADDIVESAHADYERAEASQALRDELALLPPDQKRMLYLAFFEGLSHTEIAARTGIALGTVKGRIRSPLKKMREKLKAFDGEDE